MNRQNFQVGVVVFIVFCIVSILSYKIHLNQVSKVQLSFEKEIEKLSISLKNELQKNLESVQYLASNIGTIGTFDKEDFKRLTKPLLNNNPSIQALEWIPYITYEKYQNLKSQFKITQRNKTGQLVEVSKRDYYYPVYYVEPFRGNEKAYGFDLASNEKRFKALELSKNTNSLQMTSSITLVQDSEKSKGFLAFYPVISNNNSFEGFALGVFKINTIIDELNALQSRDLFFEIFDKTSNSSELLYASQTNSIVLSEHTYNKKLLNSAGREWVLKAKLTKKYIQNNTNALPYVVFFMGIIILFLALFIFARQRKESNHRLQSYHKKYQNMMSLSSDALFILDPMDGTLLDYSEQTKKFLGYSDEEMKGLNVMDWDKFPSLNDFINLAAQIEESKPTKFERVHTRKDGSTYPAEISAVKINDGDSTYIYASVRDISEQKESLRMLTNAKENIEKIKNIFDKHSIIAVTDTAGTILSVNEAFLKISGYSQEELIGNNHRILNSGNQPKSYWKNMYETVQSGKIWRDDVKNVDKNGNYYWADTTILSYITNENTVNYISIRTDITHLKNVEQQLIEAKNSANKASVAKSLFLANMSHEIRTPMTGLLGFIERLKKGEQDPERLKQFEIIKNSGNTLLCIINDILDFSKIESGKLEIEKAPIMINQLLVNTPEMFHHLASVKNINLIGTISDNLPRCVLGDETRLKQVLNNLINNSIKFTNDGGSITLQARYLKEEQNIYVAVIDTGIGIAKENLEKIFDAFSQEDASTTRKFGGTGLGLTISSRLVKLMDGELKVESEVGKGSKFYFELPVEICSQNIQEEIEDSLMDTTGLKGHVLVVEDNKTNQMLIGMILDDHGITYDVANDGAEGVLKYKHNNYDLILMDENMPIMNGIEATKLIREEDKNAYIPIIAVTANALVKDRERFIEAGMNDYISKPFSEEDIISVLKKYLY